MQMGGRKGNCVSRCVFAAMRGGGAASALFARHIRPLTPPSFPAPVPAPSAPEENFYTVLFGVSRALGVLSQVGGSACSQTGGVSGGGDGGRQPAAQHA